MHRYTAVVVALSYEARTLRDLGGTPAVRIAGIGAVAAARAATAVVANGARALISWGVAAGLVDDLQSGTLLLPESVRGADAAAIPVDESWRCRIETVLRGADLAVSAGVLAETPTLLDNAAQKRALHRRCGAVAADMESAAIGRIASRARVPFIVVRSVLDTPHLDLPPALLGALDVEGDVRPGRLLGALARRPADAVAMARLAVAAGRAARALRTAARFARPLLDRAGGGADTGSAPQ